MSTFLAFILALEEAKKIKLLHMKHSYAENRIWRATACHLKGEKLFEELNYWSAYSVLSAMIASSD